MALDSITSQHNIRGTGLERWRLFVLRKAQNRTGFNATSSRDCLYSGLSQVEMSDASRKVDDGSRGLGLFVSRKKNCHNEKSPRHKGKFPSDGCNK
jgi:hypothetical protein